MQGRQSVPETGGLLAVTGQRFWIDEGSAALKAMEPSFGGWWQNLRSEGNSNLQLIGQLFYLGGWEKIFGSSEFALRLSNVPLFVGGVLGAGLGDGRQGAAGQSRIVLLALTNAFLWYYLSEARPYVVLFGFAAVDRLLPLPPSPGTGGNAPLRFLVSTFLPRPDRALRDALDRRSRALGAIGAALYWNGPRALARCALRFTLSSAFLAAGMAALARPRGLQ